MDTSHNLKSGSFLKTLALTSLWRRKKSYLRQKVYQLKVLYKELLTSYGMQYWIDAILDDKMKAGSWQLKLESMRKKNHQTDHDSELAPTNTPQRLVLIMIGFNSGLIEMRLINSTRLEDVSIGDFDGNNRKPGNKTIISMTNHPSLSLPNILKDTHNNQRVATVWVFIDYSLCLW